MKNGNGQSSAAIEIKGLNVNINNLEILDNVSATVPEGKNTGVIGPNGAGKTTLIRALLGDIKYTGKVEFFKGGQHSRPRIGYVPQRFVFDRAVPLTVVEFLSMGVQKMPFWLGIKRISRNDARKLLGDVKAEYLEKRLLGELSGGELQRVLLALAIQQGPDILVLDEPDAGVDVSGSQVFCELLENLRSMKGFTQLMVSHDLGMVAYHANHVICLNKTVVAEGPPAEVLRTDVLSGMFGPHFGTLGFQAFDARYPACCESGCKRDRDA